VSEAHAVPALNASAGAVSKDIGEVATLPVV
jgi:hypothetical protein